MIMPVADGAHVSSIADTSLDAVDKKILGMIQSGFPLASRPYAAIGEEAGISEAEALARVRAMRQCGVIRRVGANFQSRKVGYHSTLCGAKVPPEKLDAFIAAVNAEPGVTHNYLRDHAYNVWFTYIAPSEKHVADALEGLSRYTGVGIVNLPAKKLYKIKVDFQMDGTE